MPHENYLFWFRFQFPIDRANKDDHEVIEPIVIVAKSEDEALFWGNKIAEKYIQDLFIKNKYHTKKIGFTSFIWDNCENIDDSEKKEAESFPFVHYGEYPKWKI